MTEYKSNKNLLIVTTSFAPENAIGAVRLSAMAKHLAKGFKEVYVICPSPNDDSISDDTLYINYPANLEVIRVKSSIFFRLTKQLRNRLLVNKKASEVINLSNKQADLITTLKSLLLRLAFKLFTHLKNRDFLRGALKNFKKLSIDTEINYLITSYPSYSSHQAGLSIKKLNNGIKWIADFRDPMIYSSFNTSMKLAKIQNEVINNADHIITVSHGVKELLGGTSLNKIDVIFNGFDHFELEPLASFNKQDLNLCYVGTLYDGKRDLSCLFKILSRIYAEKQQQNLKFHYAGSDILTLMNQATTFNLADCIINHGYVSRQESLKIQKSCDFIVVGTWNSVLEKGILTGKMFEAFMLKKPIIGVVNGDLANSEFKKIIQDCNAGIIIESNFISRNEEHQIIEFLQTFIDFKLGKNQKSPSDIFSFEVEKFNYNNVFKKLFSIINKL